MRVLNAVGSRHGRTKEDFAARRAQVLRATHVGARAQNGVTATSRRAIAGWASLALGAGIAVSAMLGPLVLKVIQFRTSDNAENQFVGGEVVSLGIVAPALIVAGVMWRRGHRLAPALAFGPALYAVYTYVTAVIGQDYARYPGNVEKFFPLYAALVAGGTVIAALAAGDLAGSEGPVPSDRLRRFTAGLFMTIGGFFALAWAAQIRLVYIGQPPTEYQEDPTLFWLIKLLDLGFVIPALIGTGIGLLRQHPVAIKAAPGMAAFATCMAAAIAGMAIAMEVKGDPAASLGMLMFVLPVAGVLAGTTVSLLSSYTRGDAVPRSPYAAPGEGKAWHAG